MEALQIQYITSSSEIGVMWRYPVYRAIFCLEVLPLNHRFKDRSSSVPGLCELSFWDDFRKSFVAWTSFSYVERGSEPLLYDLESAPSSFMWKLAWKDASNTETFLSSFPYLLTDCLRVSSCIPSTLFTAMDLSAISDSGRL